MDAAISMGIEHGGWCPRGRVAEDGKIPHRYQLRETESSQYRERTERNVLDSDATLILYRVALRGGTELTRRLAVQHDKPYLLVDLARPLDASVIHQWLISESVRTLNVAGPRESMAPGIAAESRTLIRSLFVPRSKK